MLSPLHAAVAAAAEAATLHEFADGALPELQRALGASNALFYRYDDAGQMIGMGGSLSRELGGYSRELLALDPLQGPPRRMAPGLKVVMITREVDPRAYRASDAYHLFYRPHDLEHVTCAWLTGDTRYGEPGMTGILFGRAAREQPFSEREVGALRRALPALAGAVRRATRVAATEERRAALEAIAATTVTRPLVAFAPSGAVLWMSPAAETLLDRRAVPRSLIAEVRRVGALASDAHPLAPRACAITEGEPLRAELSIARAPRGDTVIVAELAAPAARDRGLEALAREHDLTRAETDVLRILALGLSNKQIAARLHVSVETVRTHVARILRKTGAATRTQAALLTKARLG
jgi:DNA-binding CsgD family transcriptional regulator